jgi:branched-chain amino acid transport system ATP-binding protein
MSESLAVCDLQAWYGESKVLHGMDFSVRAGEVVTLLGRNGAGKTTTLKAIMGLLDKRSGSIALDGHELIGAAPYDIARKGIAFCPEERGIFASLSVRENLLLPPKVAAGGMTVAQILTLFPNLKERLDSQGTKLSGDEPTEGLAPVIIRQIGRTITELKALGFTILLVEQNVGFAAGLADRHYIMELGRVVEEIPGAAFEGRLGALKNYLGL